MWEQITANRIGNGCGDLLEIVPSTVKEAITDGRLVIKNEGEGPNENGQDTQCASREEMCDELLPCSQVAVLEDRHEGLQSQGSATFRDRKSRFLHLTVREFLRIELCMNNCWRRQAMASYPD